jgi:hypothetical protein
VGTTEELLPVREVYKRVKVSADKGTRLKNELLKRELLTEMEVPLRSRGRASKLLVLTREGREVVGLPPLSGKGGALHQHIQRLVASYAEQQGYTATIEGSGTNGKQVDISLEKDGKRVAVEISVTTRAAHELENIRRDLNGGYTNVICLFASPAALEATQCLLKDQVNARVYGGVCCGIVGLVKEYRLLIGEVLK